MIISQHISYSEATRTDTGLKNDPNTEQLSNMRRTAAKIFEPLRLYFDVPIYVSSFFRSVDVNKAIGGAVKSQHVKGEAMDLDAHVYGKITNKQIFDFIRQYLPFDQLIWEAGDDNEPGWIHVSHSAKKQRGQILKMKDGKYTEYV